MEGTVWVTFFLTIFAVGRGFQLSVDVRPPHGQLAASVLFSLSTNPPQTYASILWTVNGNIITQCIRMNCITPPPYQTRINDNFTAATGSLQLNHLTLSDTGEYRITLQSTESVERTSVVWFGVYEVITNTSITGPREPVLNGTLSLTCNATGYISSTVWLKDGYKLVPSNRIIISQDNKTLQIQKVTKNDAGLYECKLTNPVSTGTASYTLFLVYGPDNVSIMGEGRVALNSTVLLYCNADSIPVAEYRWTFNGKETDVKTAGYIIKRSHYNDSGSYVCIASNALNGLSGSATHNLLVTDKVGPSLLAPAEVAGIVIGVIAAVALLALAVYFGLSRSRVCSTDEVTSSESQQSNTYENVSCRKSPSQVKSISEPMDHIYNNEI